MNQTTPMPENNEVLLKAVRRVQAALHLTQEQLLSILKTQSLERLDVSSEAGSRAAILIWIYQRLCAYVGDDKKALRHWVDTHNRSLGDRPVDVMATNGGLELVDEYLRSLGV